MNTAQQMYALERANEVRRARRLARAAAGSGEVSVAMLIATVPACLATIRVDELLTWGPRTKNTHARAARWMTAAGVGPYKTLGGLTDRQRDALAELVRAHERRKALPCAS